MTYNDIYGAVNDLYDRDAAWDELVTVGSRESLNLAEEAIGRHAESNETGLRIRDFETGEHEAYSFAELNAAADRVANYLVARAGLHDRVGVMLQPSLELYAAAFGTLKAGRIWVSLDVLFGPDALSYQVHDSGATVLFTSAEHLEKVDPNRLPTLERVVVVDSATADERDHITIDPYETIEAESSTFETVPTHPNDVHKILYSGGTTGQPKGVPITHGWPVVAHHAYVKYVIDLQPADTYFVAVSPAWGYGSFFGTVTPGMVGTAIGSYRGRFDPERFMETLVEWDVTSAFAPPTSLKQVRAAEIDMDPADFELRVLVTAGEALDEETADWCREYFGVRPLDAYGASETGLIVCNYSFPDWESKPGSMGRPLPGRAVVLLDDDGGEVETGGLGEVAVRRQTEAWGDHCGEYWGQPSASLDLFEGPWLRVGDLARRDEDGYYWYYARQDAVINSAGHRIGPAEVEETLLKHDAVTEACVVGVPDETGGERVKAFVVLVERESPSEDLKAEITGFARSQLSKHAYPREVDFLPELPKTATGKIDRTTLERR